mmetsp:Transcript_21183/g.52490  ORF Transcript_21183/g.52490 Transcript_21183/m.52490 type:complete len:264 (+) Transcript_21183:1047-1838(+)
MILGTTQGRAPLGFIEITTAFGNNLGDGTRSNKGHGSNILVVDECLDTRSSPLDHVEHAIGHASLFEEIGSVVHRQRNLFARLEDHRVAHDESNGDGPHGHHEGKIKRNNRGNHSEGIPAIRTRDLAGNSQSVPDRRLGQSAGPLDRLVSLGDVCQRLGNVLAVFFDNELRHCLGVFLYQSVEFHHDRGALLDGLGRPGRKRILGGLHGIVDVAFFREPDFADGLGVCWIYDIHVVVGRRRDESPVDIVVDDCHFWNVFLFQS